MNFFKPLRDRAEIKEKEYRAIYNVESGTPVLACASGRVEDIGINDNNSKWVVLIHNGGYRSYYGNLNNTFVQMGQNIVDEVLGLSGNTLDFEVGKRS